MTVFVLMFSALTCLSRPIDIVLNNQANSIKEYQGDFKMLFLAATADMPLTKDIIADSIRLYSKSMQDLQFVKFISSS